MTNRRALRLKENSAEFETKLSDIKRLKKALEAYLNKNFYFERSSPFSFARIIQAGETADRNLLLIAKVDGRGVSFGFFIGPFPINEDAQLDLATIRVVHESLDTMIELAEELCKKINRLDSFKSFLNRFDVE